MLIRHFLFLLTALFLFPHPVSSQNGGYHLFRSFTVADGLPSNYIYTCVEDNKGFIWVATQEGIARFDGKHFQTFTVKDGLPDNEVLDVVKEKNGRIWVNCFKQSPAYFDEVRNRFINAREDSNLAKVNGTGVLDLVPLADGGVMYCNQNGTYVFKEGKVEHFFYGRPDFWGILLIRDFQNGSYLTFGSGVQGANPKLVFVKEGKLLDSLAFPWMLMSGKVNRVFENKRLYLVGFKTGKYHILSDFQTNPMRYRHDSISIGEPIAWRRFTPDLFIIISQKGRLFVYDKQNLQFKFALDGNYSPNSLYDDSKGNVWVSSKDKGLILYKRNTIESFAMPDNFSNTQFISLARKAGGPVLAGNYYGQVVETDGRFLLTHRLPDSSSYNWLRKIIVSQDKVFTFGESGIYVNYTVPILNPAGNNQQAKTAVRLNDSLIVVGTIGKLSAINTRSLTFSVLPTLIKRVTCLATASGRYIYHGSTDGLYRFDYEKAKDDSLQRIHPLLAERISALCVTPDQYVWVATAGNGVAVILHDSVIKVFTEKEGIISNSIKCLAAGRPGEVWMGSNSGITLLRYKDSPADFSYQNLTINDGLSSNIINEMLYDKDTVYCATGNGICAIPAGIRLDRFDIPVQLTRVIINNRDTFISGRYDLGYEQNNIELHLAGIEPGGHFKYFQYRINKGDWLNLETNVLNLQFNSGSYTLYVRAIDVNGNAGSRPLELRFNIETPFWKSIWFWVLMVIGAGVLLVWILRKREVARREAALQGLLNQKKLTELELQALRSQINPHFIFNCLNSIKLLSHQQQHAEAEKYLDRFAAVLRSAMEQSSLQQISLNEEIHFLENYLSLEKLRFPDTLNYSIDVDPAIQPSQILIPSMLLQPYVENAVRHGIAPIKNRQGQVLVRFYVKDNVLMAEVQDNGNGIEKQNKLTRGTGIGMANTERRSDLFRISTKLTDLGSLGTGLQGTLVQLAIPLVTHNHPV